MVKYKGKEYTGYWSWCAALNRALDNGIKITSADFFASVSKDDLREILKSDSDYDIPMFEERWEVLQEAGKVLMKKYNGQFSNVIEKCEKSAQSLLKLVVTDFPSYRDTAEYNGKKVSFYKRAQILIADIWSCFEGKSYGEFNDIDTITMFADYRIPQSLVFFGAMEYSEELMNYLKKGTMMKTGDRFEMEIRGCSIWATEMICKQTRQMLDDDDETKDTMVNSILIDHFLWDFRRDNNDKMPHIPFHRIRCIYY
ncbi:hypothetical protein FSP39_025282 [Pinctada imbricata]|uniref:Queuosine 5'-phosphate N-glycosylase/hydrolase n=1 Tax=Pinctada imbricata TaxID=66713 RepID=A0AA88YGE4_PINIB|nr:hypothetical protein FSP39_025282 [Pinctada imbricata]